METKELIKGLRAMSEWPEDHGFDSEIYVKNAPNSKCVYALEVVEEIIKRLEEHEKIKGIVRNSHLTGDHTMRDLLKLMKSGQIK